MTTRRYRLTRDLPAGEAGSFFPRDLKAGAVLFECQGAYAVTNVDFSRGACVTEDPDGGYPGFEVPLSAVEEVRDGEAAGEPLGRRPGDRHDHSWAEDAEEAWACCPDLNPGLAGTGIRCPGDPEAELRDEIAAAAGAVDAARDAREAWNDPDAH
jgi:hypothetical protein